MATENRFDKETIGGVPRSELERALKLASIFDDDSEGAVGILRALLDAPAYPNRICHIDYTAHPYICGCLKGHEEAQRRFDERYGTSGADPKAQGEPVACMPVDRCYDVRAKMIIAFNETKKAGGDLDDALDAAYKSALRYSPNPMTFEQPAPVAVDTERLDFILSKSRTVTTEILPDGYALYVEEGLMGEKIYPHVKASTVGRENRKVLQRQAIDLAIAEIRLNVAKS